MASTIKVDNVQNQPGTNIINKCSTTITVGAACNSMRVAGNNVQASDGGNIIDQCGTTITVGASGDTVALAAGASSSGFGRTGAVDWDTTPKTATFSAVNGTGYFVNTTSGVVTANLPAGSAGDIVAFSDYLNTWDSNAITVSPDGSEKINGGNFDVELATTGLSVTLIYVDGTIGWKNIDDATSNVTGLNPYIVASGGNTTITCGDYKLHVFTGPGALCVSAAGLFAPCSGKGSDKVDYLVVAGGGGGGGPHGGGGGGGGLRTFMPASTPMAAPAGLAVSIQPYAITVGGGGSSGTGAGTPKQGSDSIFSSITSAGSGGGGNNGAPASDGGSGGGGGGTPSTVGSGNTPPVTPDQGTDGGLGGGAPNLVGGGGGGASTIGAATPGSGGGTGGDGGYIPDAMIGPTAPTYGTPGPAGSTRYWAGGGGGGGWYPKLGGPGGAGGGAAGGNTLGSAGCNAAANTGGGGGGGNSGDAPGGPGGSGGSGLVVVRYKFQN